MQTWNRVNGLISIAVPDHLLDVLSCNIGANPPGENTGDYSHLYDAWHAVSLAQNLLTSTP